MPVRDAREEAGTRFAGSRPRRTVAAAVAAVGVWSPRVSVLLGIASLSKDWSKYGSGRLPGAGCPVRPALFNLAGTG